MATTTFRRAVLRLPALLLVATLAALTVSPALPAAARAADRPLRIAMGSFATLDPAEASSASDSNIIAQLFETLTYIDESGVVQPGLAGGWDFAPDGMSVTFTLRDGLAFSDGTPLTGDDVVRSWLRVLAPERQGLKSLLFGVAGARAYATGAGPASGVGISAGGQVVTLALARRDADMPAILASPTFAIVPPNADQASDFAAGPDFVASGGYRLTAATEGALTLRANPHYWAGEPAIRDVTIVTALAKDSETSFKDGDVDWVEVSSVNAPFLRYDRDLGPQLREWAELSTLYYGFDTTKAPFDDVRVRQAFAAAVDWRRIVDLSSATAWQRAQSLVPPGIAGRSETDFIPAFDPDRARQLLSEAGFSDPATFPAITLVTSGGEFDEIIAGQLEGALGITVNVEWWDYREFYARWGTDQGPLFWSMMWIADYPSPYDFLEILLGTGQDFNRSGWSNAAFDEANARAVSAEDVVTATAAYDDAAALVRDEVPVIPVAHNLSAALSREGLLGAGIGGLGIPQISHMAWAEDAP